VFLNNVEIGQSERSDTRGREIEGGRASKTAHADDQYAGLCKLLLALNANFRQDDLPAVTSQLFGGEYGVCGFDSHQS